jgi:hypothetical protein
MANMGKRPGVVVAAAILLFILGGLSILGACCGIGSVLMRDTLENMIPKPPEIQGKKPMDGMALNRQVEKELPSKVFVESGFHVFNLLLGLVKVGLGIGLLRLLSAARTFTFAIAVCSILTSMGQQLYEAIVVAPVMQRAFAEQAKDMPQEMQGLGTIMQAGAWGGAVLGIVISLAIWITVMVLLSGAKVRSAFAGADSESSSEDDEEKPRSRYEGYDDGEGPPPRSPGETGITER